MSTFLTGGDDGYDASELSGVDRQRQEEREWRVRFEDAQREHDSALAAASAREQELAVSVQRETDRALRAETAAAKAVAEIVQLKAAHATALQAAAAEREEERKTTLESSAALEAALQQQLAAATSRAVELQASLEVEEAQVATVSEAKSALKTKLVQSQQQGAIYYAAAQAVPPLRRQCLTLRKAVAGLRAEQKTSTEAFAAGLGELRRALAHGEDLRAQLLAAAEAKATALRTELRTTNREASAEFDGYQAKIDGLRRQLVEVDNEKCTAKTRASQLERECAALQERLQDVERRANEQASQVVRMLGELEAREEQCNSDFQRLRELSERVQVRCFSLECRMLPSFLPQIHRAVQITHDWIFTHILLCARHVRSYPRCGAASFLSLPCLAVPCRAVPCVGPRARIDDKPN